jgi:hypothetical protein
MRQTHRYAQQIGDLPERITLESAIVTEERLDTLRSVFPEVFREGKVDFGALPTLAEPTSSQWPRAPE